MKDFGEKEEAMLATSRKAQAPQVPAGPAIEPGDATAAISGQNERGARRPVEDSAEGRRADLSRGNPPTRLAARNHAKTLIALERERQLELWGHGPMPLERGMGVRLQGDGPSSWTCWLVVARPRRKEFMQWGTLPGAYVGAPPSRGSASGAKSVVVGQKPLWLMSAIVRDYSKPGDLVCDPYSGGGTTALACAVTHRRFVGAEVNPATHASAVARLAGGVRADDVQADLFGGAA